MKTADTMNAQTPDDGVSATYGPTQFADLTTEEFKAQYLNLRLHPDAPTAEEWTVSYTHNCIFNKLFTSYCISGCSSFCKD